MTWYYAEQCSWYDKKIRGFFNHERSGQLMFIEGIGNLLWNIMSYFNGKPSACHNFILLSTCTLIMCCTFENAFAKFRRDLCL